jgi:predicted metalloprotease with PDZ domain
MKLFFSGAVFLLSITASAFAQTTRPAGPVDIAFTIGMSRTHTHMFEVDVRIKHASIVPAEESLIMPVWTPGSYLIREFERNVQDFAAKDSNGQPLKWEKTRKDTWRITTNGAAEACHVSCLR